MQPMQQKRQKCNHSTATALLLLLCYLVATVASVPTSVLAQNSEVTSNMMSLNANKPNLQVLAANPSTNHNNNMDNNNSKVKRSSNEGPSGSMNMASSGLDKKSSPEVLPPAFNMPSSSSASSQQQEELQQLQQLQHQQPQQANQQQRQAQASSNSVQYTLPSNSEILAAVEAAAAAAGLNQNENDQRQSQYYGASDEGYDNQINEYPMVQPHKRGLVSSPQYYYDGLGGAYDNFNGNAGNVYGGLNVPNDYYNPYLGAGMGSAIMQNPDGGLVAVPNGYWADDDAGLVYTDLQDVNDYAAIPRAPSNYRSKAYDNLQNILNSEAYMESAAAAAPIPVQYAANRYYSGLEGDHTKRNKFNNRYGDYRLKRDTKLTPADMLALVALVEAGERARQDNEEESRAQQYDFNNNNKNAFDYYVPMLEDTYEYTGNPNTMNGNLNNLNSGLDYYGMPLNMETFPKYANQQYEQNNENLGQKRYMIAKRKRSMGKFMNDPVGKPSVAYNGEKYY